MSGVEPCASCDSRTTRVTTALAAQTRLPPGIHFVWVPGFLVRICWKWTGFSPGGRREPDVRLISSKNL